MATRQQLWREIKDIIPVHLDRKIMKIRYGSKVYLAEILTNLRFVKAILNPIITDAEEIKAEPLARTRSAGTTGGSPGAFGPKEEKKIIVEPIAEEIKAEPLARTRSAGTTGGSPGAFGPKEEKKIVVEPIAEEIKAEPLAPGAFGPKEDLTANRISIADSSLSEARLAGSPFSREGSALESARSTEGRGRNTYNRIIINIDDINCMYNFKTQHYHRDEETVKTHTSLKGGKYLINSDEHPEFFKYVSLSYSKYFVNNVGEEIWTREYLSEIIPDKCAYNKFKFFLDIETKDKDFSISSDVIDKITSTLNYYIRQNTSYDKYIEPVISVNSKFRDQKVHLVFPSICVDKSTYKEILHNLTISLDDYKIANCIDCSVNGLRLLGSSKNGEDDIESDMKGQYVPIKNYSGQLGGFSVKSNGNKRFFYPFRNHVNPENIKLFSIRDTSGCDLLTLNNRSPVRVLNNEFFLKFVLPSEEDIKDQTTYLVDGLGEYRSRERKYWYSIGLIIYHLSEGEEWGFDLYSKFSNRSVIHSGISEDTRRKEFYNFENKDSNSRIGYWNILINCYKKDTCHIPSFVIERDVSDKSTIFTRVYEEDWDIYKSNIQIIQKGTYCEFVEKSIFEDSKRKTTLVKASLGNGKTKSIKDYLLDNPHLSVVWISPRISFTQSFMCDKKFVEESGFEDYISIRNERIDSKRVIIQYESLNRLKRDYDVVVCDEIESVLIQMISKETNQRNIDYNFEILSNIIKNAKKVILADAYLSKRTLTLAKCLGLGEDICIFSYDKPRAQRTSYTYESLKDTLNHIIDNIKKGKKSYLFCTSKKKLVETIIPTLKKYVPEFDNVSMVYTSSYQKNVNPNIWGNKLLIATTSKITVGVDCQTSFDDIFCIAFRSSGVLTRDICQSLYRVRNITGSCYFYIDEKQNNMRSDKTPFSLSHSHLYFNNLKCLKKSIVSSDWNVKWGASPFETMFVISKTEYSFNNMFFKEMMMKFLEISGYKFVDFTLKSDYDDIVFEHTDDIDFFKIDLCNYGNIQHKLDNSIKLTDEEVLKMFKQKFLNSVDFKAILDEFQDKPLFEAEVNTIFKKFMDGSLGLRLLKTCKQSLDKLMEYQPSRYGSAIGNDIIYHKIYSLLVDSEIFNDYDESEEIGFDFFETEHWKSAYELLKTVKRLSPRKKHTRGKYNASQYQEERKALNMFLKSIGYKLLLGRKYDRSQTRKGFTINYMHQICGIDFINYVKL